jgi:hypothetical protein
MEEVAMVRKMMSLALAAVVGVCLTGRLEAQDATARATPAAHKTHHTRATHRHAHHATTRHGSVRHGAHAKRHASTKTHGTAVKPSAAGPSSATH